MVVLVGLLLDFFSSVFFVSFDLLAVLVFELVVAVELEVDFGALFVALVVLVVLVGVFVFCVNFIPCLFYSPKKQHGRQQKTKSEIQNAFNFSLITFFFHKN